MSQFVLDTNVLVFAMRNAQSFTQVRQTLDPFHSSNRAYISVVTFAEINSFAYRQRWGPKKLSDMQLFFSLCKILDIYSSDVQLQTSYQEIDAFSQGLHLTKPLNRSAVNMGKNDLWIAASAHVAGADLITFDKDFLHLNGVFFKVHYFPV